MKIDTTVLLATFRELRAVFEALADQPDETWDIRLRVSGITATPQLHKDRSVQEWPRVSGAAKCRAHAVLRVLSNRGQLLVWSFEDLDR